MRRERGIAMMALAVDVGRERTAERDVARAGHHCGKKSARQKYPDDLVDRHAGFGMKNRGFGIEGEHSVEALHIDDAVFRIEGSIAVGATGAARDQLVRGDRKSTRL